MIPSEDTLVNTATLSSNETVEKVFFENSTLKNKGLFHAKIQNSGVFLQPQRHNQRRARAVVAKKLKPAFARPLHLKLGAANAKLAFLDDLNTTRHKGFT